MLAKDLQSIETALNRCRGILIFQKGLCFYVQWESCEKQPGCGGSKNSVVRTQTRILNKDDIAFLKDRMETGHCVISLSKWRVGD